MMQKFVDNRNKYITFKNKNIIKKSLVVDTLNFDLSLYPEIIQDMNNIYQINLLRMYESQLAPGIDNVGNTCFYNAATQLFYRMIELREFLLKDDVKQQYKADKYIRKYLIIMQEMSNKRGGIVYPSTTNVLGSCPLKYIERGTEYKYRIGRQEDAQEFLNSILQRLRIECDVAETDMELNISKSFVCNNKIIKKKFPDGDPRNLFGYLSVYDRISFLGDLKLEKSKRDHGNIKQIDFPIDYTTETLKQKTWMDVQDLINLLFKTEEVEFRLEDEELLEPGVLTKLKKDGLITKVKNRLRVYSGTYKKNKSFEKNVEKYVDFDVSSVLKSDWYENIEKYREKIVQLEILNAASNESVTISIPTTRGNRIEPLDYFIVQLKLFKVVDEIDIKLKYTGNIITEKIHEGIKYDLDVGGIKYECIGTVIHSGGAGGGHYYAYIKYLDEWYQLNDTSRSGPYPYKVWYEGIKKSPSNDPYMILYRKIQKDRHGKQIHKLFDTIPDNKIVADLSRYLVNI